MVIMERQKSAEESFEGFVLIDNDTDTVLDIDGDSETGPANFHVYQSMAEAQMAAIKFGLTNYSTRMVNMRVSVAFLD